MNSLISGWIGEGMIGLDFVRQPITSSRFTSLLFSFNDFAAA
jgi:hypothetical protein